MLPLVNKTLKIKGSAGEIPDRKIGFLRQLGMVLMIQHHSVMNGQQAETNFRVFVGMLCDNEL